MLLYDNVVSLHWDPQRILADVKFSVSLECQTVETSTSQTNGNLILCSLCCAQCLLKFLCWILMELQPDKSNMFSPVLMYKHVSESPLSWQSCYNTAELKLWLTINLKEQKHCSMAGEAWQRWQKQLSPDSSLSRQSGPVAQHLSASIRFPPKTH